MRQPLLCQPGDVDLAHVGTVYLDLFHVDLEHVVRIPIDDLVEVVGIVDGPVDHFIFM